MMKKRKRNIVVIWLTMLLALTSVSCAGPAQSEVGKGQNEVSQETVSQETESGYAGDTTDAQEEICATVEEVPDYYGEPYVEINDNEPDFSQDELTTEAYESYSELDDLGRCGVAEACIGEEIMPTEERGKIGQVRPSGWQTAKYDCVEGKYLYNRCHLIGYQLSGENANESNLITGTRYMNTIGMLPFENMVAEYVHDTENHVMYRVTPIFLGDDLVASGVQMEAESVEDGGAGVCFNVYIYNIQPEIIIDYATGENWSAEEAPDTIRSTGTAGDGSSISAEGNRTQEDTTDKVQSGSEEHTYILNKGTMKFHKPDCPSVSDMKTKNKKEFKGTREEVTGLGYEPCGRCKP